MLHSLNCPASCFKKVVLISPLYSNFSDSNKKAISYYPQLANKLIHSQTRSGSALSSLPIVDMSPYRPRKKLFTACSECLCKQTSLRLCSLRLSLFTHLPPFVPSGCRCYGFFRFAFATTYQLVKSGARTYSSFCRLASLK